MVHLCFTYIEYNSVGCLSTRTVVFYSTLYILHDNMLRKASEARVNRRLRRYCLIVLLLPNIFTLACLLLSSI